MTEEAFFFLDLVIHSRVLKRTKNKAGIALKQNWNMEECPKTF